MIGEHLGLTFSKRESEQQISGADVSIYSKWQSMFSALQWLLSRKLLYLKGTELGGRKTGRTSEFVLLTNCLLPEPEP
jgi:hypothetical protein